MLLFLLYGYARAALAWTKKKQDGSYRTAQVGLGDRRRKKSKTEEDGSYHSAPWRQSKKEELDWNICQITQSIYLTTYTLY